MQARYKLLAGHLPLLENDNSSKPVPGYDPGHTLGTGDQEPHNLHIRIYRPCPSCYHTRRSHGPLTCIILFP
ncbi:hypothetical protein DSO57_1035937 [Entomophthora muscae]|uniref:Uncharacterized protein n=1 Tax=Entomophthora muscae TaxID=34485 RepID=A0ACC2SZJ6_9FUNG|nr:hypothetical protein DSO57_1035937 [Entomophthora muscae]